MAEKQNNTFNIIIIVLLLINTFFLAGIFSTLICGDKGFAFCPLGKNKSKNLCPLTGKNFNKVKGSSYEQSNQPLNSLDQK